MEKSDKFFLDKCPCSKTVEKSLFGPELLSRTIHRALTIDPDNCFEHNRFNHSKSVNLSKTTKTLVNRRRLHKSKRVCRRGCLKINNDKTRLECEGSLDCLFPTKTSMLVVEQGDYLLL